MRAEPVDDALAAARQEDYATALRLADPLARTGDPRAEFVLGLLYEKGRGIMMDAAAAAEWYRRAADQGLAEAQNNLGALYSNGEGVRHDHAEALKWWTLAADQGLVTSQANLAELYAEGDGVPHDLVQAYKWSALAAGEGERRGAETLNQVSMQMTPEQISEAAKLVDGWRPSPRERI